jgi:hypothetical protein
MALASAPTLSRAKFGVLPVVRRPLLRLTARRTFSQRSLPTLPNAVQNGSALLAASCPHGSDVRWADAPRSGCCVRAVWYCHCAEALLSFPLLAECCDQDGQ